MNHGHLEEFNPAFLEFWDTYAKHLKFFEAKKITNATLKHTTLFRICCSTTIEIAQNLMAPAELSETPYKDIMALLRNHFSPQSLHTDGNSNLKNCFSSVLRELVR